MTTTVGQALIRELETRGVTHVFGIPGVHTIELYRGLAASGIRHVTPRHEQGAGFMADGYARASGRPGVAFVITGPGLTNTLTPMAQARADSIPMLVISSTGARPYLGKGLGRLHELPDQHGLAAQVALASHHVAVPEALAPAVQGAFDRLGAGRPGPVHIELPLDVLAEPSVAPGPAAAAVTARPPSEAQIAEAAALLRGAQTPVILAGGGARGAADALRQLAERLDAPVVLTTNGRGIMHRHRLGVPASPSLGAVRQLIAGADVVLAVGTEMGATDYDMYGDGGFALPGQLIRIDICSEQIARQPSRIGLAGDSAAVIGRLLAQVPAPARDTGGAARAGAARSAAEAEIGPDMRALVRILAAVRDAVPGSIMVGDSTQPVYAGNLYYDHDRVGGWFNAATGYGALGYGIPAAIGAALALPGSPVICLTGDGGAQFTLAELMVAAQEALPVIFLVWNNRGYREIETSMQEAGVTPIGCDPMPPDFADIAAACGLPFARSGPAGEAVAQAVRAAVARGGPHLIEIQVD